jgi:hypothetical protein
MGFKTKIRGEQTKAGQSYNPASEHSLATDKEIENRSLKHEKFFHHSRTEFTRYVYTGNMSLSEIKTFLEATEENLLVHTEFTYNNGDLELIDKKVYEDTGELYEHTQKTLVYSNGILTEMNTNKIV